MFERSMTRRLGRTWSVLGLAALLGLPACNVLKRFSSKDESAPAEAATAAPESKATSASKGDEQPPAGSVSSGSADAQGWAVGDKVQVQWKGKWYPSTILAVGDNGTYKIHYDGWGAEWDEWVTPARMRGGSGSAAPAQAAAAHKVGEKVQVSWKGKWYAATILAVGNNNTYKVHYDGWGAEWDEWVTPARMR